MRVHNVSFIEAAGAAEFHTMRAQGASGGGRSGYTGIRLLPVGSTYQRQSPRLYSPYGGSEWGGRRVNAVCWHGHARWLRELFARYGDRPGVWVDSTAFGRPIGGHDRGSSGHPWGNSRVRLFPDRVLDTSYPTGRFTGDGTGIPASNVIVEYRGMLNLPVGRVEYSPLRTGWFILRDWLEYSANLNVGSEYAPTAAVDTCVSCAKRVR